VSVATIAPLSAAVKGHRSPVEGSEPQDPRWAARPDVLSRMPPSCRAVFAAITALASEDRSIKTTVSELAKRTCYSRRQVRRALHRLHAANVIRWRGAGRGRGATGVVELRWRSYPHLKWASQKPLDSADRKRDREALISENKNYITKEALGLKSNHFSSPSTGKEVSASPPTHPTVADRPLWGDGPAWCTRRLWSSLAGQVRRRAIQLWGPYGGVATDAILSTAARAVRGGLIESEDELRDLVRHLGGRLRSSGHAIEILRDRPRAHAYLGAVAKRWLRWGKVGRDLLQELSWRWERREKPLGDVTPIVGKVKRQWEKTPTDQLHRRAWELVESLGWRFELAEARWLTIVGLAAALGVPVPELPRDPLSRRLAKLREQGYPEAEARGLTLEILEGVLV